MPILLQLSDLHLNPNTPDQSQRIDAVRRHIDRISPDLIVCSGDLVEHGSQDPASLVKARKILDSLGPPVRAVPGNHDIGNKVSIGSNIITPESLHQWQNVFGNDRFTYRLNSWLILGVNSQVTGSNLPEQTQQLSWLDKQITQAEQESLQVAVYMHMPAYLTNPWEDLTGRPGYWQVDLAPRTELLQYLKRPVVRLIGSGHTHWHAMFLHERPMRVWAPSIHKVVNESYFPPGKGCLGMMRYNLEPQGVESQLVRMA